jgi:hypothetical protein
MTRTQLWTGIALLGAALAAPPAARAADQCLQFSGASCALSGDLGFFRFMGAKYPKTAKKAEALHGRACGTGTVTGTAVRSASGSPLVIGATFVCDVTPGVIEAELDPAALGLGSTHPGNASYGAFDLGTGCTVTVVDCDTEPGLP